MKLYYSPGACSMAPHIVANELGLNLEMEKVDIPTKKTESGGDYFGVNVKGYVPTLELDDGAVLTEVGVIIQYLADQKPESGLTAKAGTMERYRQMEGVNFTATEVHKQLGAFFNPKLTPEMKEVQKSVVAWRFKALDKMLAGKEYLANDKFSVADAYLFTVLNWTGGLGIDLDKWPNIKAFHARIGARPAVQKTMKEEGLVK